jgi:hypothetical protein
VSPVALDAFRYAIIATVTATPVVVIIRPKNSADCMPKHPRRPVITPRQLCHFCLLVAALLCKNSALVYCRILIFCSTGWLDEPNMGGEPQIPHSAKGHITEAVLYF